jgi:acyl carrier protein
MAIQSPQMIENGLLQWYKSRVRSGEQLTADTDLLDAGYLDSLLIMELVVSIEKQYGVAIDTEELSPQNFRSVRTLAALVAQSGN